MASWQPDWSSLNAVAAAFLQSTPLAAQIASVTPPGSYVATGLQLDLATILAEAPTGTALVIAVDTLSIAAGTTALPAQGVQIIARSVQVAGADAATLTLQGTQGALQLVTSEIIGTLAADAGDDAASPLALVGVTVPQIITYEASAPTPVTVVTDATSLADVMHSPWSVLALQLTSAIAGVVADQAGSGPLALAESMLRWVTAGCQALIANQASFPNVDYADVASMTAAAASLLSSTQAAASGAVYVPILSADLYQTQVNGILAIAQIYDSQISQFQAQQTIDQDLQQFAATLSNINAQSAGPLIVTLQNLAAETAMLETQLANAATQLDQISQTLTPLQEALSDAINDAFQKELVSTAMDILFEIATLYAGAAMAVIDPAFVAGEGNAVFKTAMDTVKDIVTAAKDPLANVIINGLDNAGLAPTDTTLAASLTGGQVLAASTANFGAALNTLWTVVGVAIAKAPAQIIYTPDFLSKLAAAPDLSSFTTGGVDPSTYWATIVTQTEAAVQPNAKLSQATAYLTAVKLAAGYGSAVGDLQMKLLDLYNQGVGTFARLQAIYQAQAQWTQLQHALTAQDQQVAAAIGLLQRGYLDVKRALVSAVANYRAAFRYQWLQDSNIAVDVSMNYLTLSQQAQQSINSLMKVLSGTASGTLKPRQDFSGITYTVTSDDGPLFTEVNGAGEAQWTIAAGDPALSAQLGGNTALYLTKATFVIDGATQTGEVELEVATSGRYESMINGNGTRFVSQALSMNNFYMPGTPPRFISSWSFADPAAYMMPTPYTDWTLTVKEGNWVTATSIVMTLTGKFLQNQSGKPVTGRQ